MNNTSIRVSNDTLLRLKTLKPRLAGFWSANGEHLRTDDDALNALMDAFSLSYPLDWSESLKWLECHRNAEPGGEIDLFDMPLPEGFPYPDGEEWTFSPHFGEQDDPVGSEWAIGKSGHVVVLAAHDVYILDPDGFKV